MFAIECEDIGKKYSLKSGLMTGSLQDFLSLQWLRSAKNQDLPGKPSDFWALRNVSFQVNQGDIVGLLGRNGAGKSTLLKLISRITAPTEGRMRIRGRVGSLLEVGVGFHPELTGKENIFLSGVMLGIRHQEIKRRYDQIVEFSGVEKFLDVPLKKYSSGMAVRLGFAVAANLDQEILLVDEVLAVGDGEFQKKCLARLAEIAHDGRTIFLVSHNLHSVLESCSRALYINSGNVVAFGNTDDVARKYTADLHDFGVQAMERMRPQKANFDGSIFGSQARFESCEVMNDDCCVRQLGNLDLKFSLSSGRSLKDPHLLLSVADSDGSVLGTSSIPLDEFWKGPGKVSMRASLEALPLVPGSYSLKVGLFEGRPIDRNIALDLLVLSPCFELLALESKQKSQALMDSYGKLFLRGRISLD